MLCNSFLPNRPSYDFLRLVGKGLNGREKIGKITCKIWTYPLSFDTVIRFRRSFTSRRLKESAVTLVTKAVRYLRMIDLALFPA